jgi:hypothetical protein
MDKKRNIVSTTKQTEYDPEDKDSSNEPYYAENMNQSIFM